MMFTPTVYAKLVGAQILQMRPVFYGDIIQHFKLDTEKMSSREKTTYQYITGVMTEYTNGMVVVIGGGARSGMDWHEAWCLSSKGELIGFWEEEV